METINPVTEGSAMIELIMFFLALYAVSGIAATWEQPREFTNVDRTPEIEQFEARFKRTRGYL